MSACGSCRQQGCNCQFVGDNVTAKVLGIGRSYEPYQVRPLSPSPAYRPVGIASATSGGQTLTAATPTLITMGQSFLPFPSTVDMWKSSNPSRLTAPFAGVYMMGGFARLGGNISGTDGAAVFDLWIAKNGVSATPLVRRSTSAASAGKRLFIDLMTLVRLSANDYIELYGQSSTTEITGSNMAGSFTTMYPYIWACWMGN